MYVAREGALEPAHCAQADGVTWQSGVRDRGPAGDQETEKRTRPKHRSRKNHSTCADAYGIWSYFAPQSARACPGHPEFTERSGIKSFRKTARQSRAVSNMMISTKVFSCALLPTRPAPVSVQPMAMGGQVARRACNWRHNRPNSPYNVRRILVSSGKLRRVRV